MKKNFIKKIVIQIVFTLIALSSIFAKEYNITKHDGAMFWTIDSTDSQGDPSRIYVLGTIHLADSTIYPVPQFILDAWNDSDKVYGEISSKDWKNYTAQFTNHILKYVINDGFDIETELTEDEIKILKEITGSNYMNFKKFEPWILLSATTSSSYKESSISAEYSYDVFFINKAKEEDIEMLGLDSLKNQLNILSYGTRETQIAMLKDALNSINDKNNTVNDLEKLYEAYKSFDENIFTEVYYTQMKKEIERQSVYKDYYKTMLDDRNEKWAKKFEQILDDGGVTFIFAGIGHFTGKNSVFHLLEKEKPKVKDIEAYNTIKEKKQPNPYEY